MTGGPGSGAGRLRFVDPAPHQASPDQWLERGLSRLYIGQYVG